MAWRPRRAGSLGRARQTARSYAPDVQRLRSILVAGALTLGVAAVAILAFRHGSEDWRYQLAGLADPFLGRPAPGTTIALGVVISVLWLVVMAVIRRRRRAEVPGYRAHLRDGRWLLIAGWAGFAVGGAVVIAQGGAVDRMGTMHVRFGAPLDSSADIPATCRSVVGEPDLVAVVSPTVERFFDVTLRNVATGDIWGPLPTVLVTQGDDGKADNDFEPPNVPVRPAAYMEGTAPGGGLEAHLPIGFLQAYDFQVARFVASGSSRGLVTLEGVRWKAPLDSADVRWVNLVLPDDPWPEAFEFTIEWTCDLALAESKTPYIE